MKTQFLILTLMTVNIISIPTRIIAAQTATGLKTLVRRMSQNSKWEYKIVSPIWDQDYRVDEKSTEELLNQLGIDGWDVFNIINKKIFRGETGQIYFILRRPINNQK